MAINVYKRIAGLAAGHGAVDFYIPVIPAILPALIPIFEGNGITSYAMTGFLFTITVIMMVIFQPLSGYLIDKNKRVIGTSMCILICAVAISLFGLTQNYWILLILAALSGIANSVYHPNAYTQIHGFTNMSNRGKFLSLFSVGGTFGYGAAPLVTGFLYAAGGFPALILLAVPGLAVALLIRRLPQHPEPKKEVIESEIVRNDKIDKVAQKTKSSKKSAALVLLISSLRTWVYYGFISFATVYLTTYKGVDYVLATGVVSSMIFAGMFGTLTAGPLSDKFGRIPVMLAAYVGGAAMYAGVFVLPGILSVISLVFTGFFLMATASVEIAAVQEFMPGNVGLASGIIIGIPQGIAAVAMVIIGLLADYFGMPVALESQVVLMILAIILCIAFPYIVKLSKRNTE